MNKEQQIEEIKEVIISVYGRSRTGGEDFLNNRQAEALYNAGYRRVPNGAVVLTPEERDEEMKEIIKTLAERDELKAENERLYEKLRQLLSSIDTVKEMNAIARGTIDEYQKKAVKEFAEKLKAKCHDNGYWDSDSNDINDEFFVHVPGTITIDDVNELLNSVVDNSEDSTLTLN